MQNEGERIAYLLGRREEGTLTRAEADELDWHERLRREEDDWVDTMIAHMTGDVDLVPTDVVGGL